MLFALLRPIAGIALRWFYSRIDVEGLERIPVHAPVLLVVNHPNALVDALVVAWVFPRRITLTAKATLFRNPIAAAFFRSAGVVPLIRAQDVSELKAASDAQRNERSFGALNGALRRGRAVLIFPEGITGDHPSLAPLKTGAARIAFQARDSGVQGLSIVPLGLVFEQKDTPRSRVFAQVGDAIDVDSWPREGDRSDAAALTAEIDSRLRAVTLNFESLDAATQSATLANRFARVLAGVQHVPPVWRPYAPLTDQVSIARRIDRARILLTGAPPAIAQRVEALLERLGRFSEQLTRFGFVVEDIEIETGRRPGTWFVLREAPVILVGGPLALWGWLNHWIPFNVAALLSRRSIESAADPAMRTIVGGLTLVLFFYAVQGALVLWMFGGLAATLYLVSLPVAADVNFYLRARLTRVMRRARAYLIFRRHPGLQRKLVDDLEWLRNEALTVEQLIVAN